MSPPRDDDPIEAGGHYDAIVNKVADVIRGLLWRFHKHNAESGMTTPDGLANGAPLIQGAIGGTIAFMIEAEMPDDKIKFLITDTMEHILPQLRIDWEGHKRGSVGEGTA